MEDRKFFLNNLWRWKIGSPEKEVEPVIDYTSLKKTEWSPEFEKLMRNRLILGGLRYGRMGHGSLPKGKPKYDRCESIRKRLKFFEDTGNAEWLVDIANLSLLMFEERQHNNFHFNSIDDGYHDKIIS
jgi:hypothetical protein